MKYRFAYADGRMPVAMTTGAGRYYLAYDQVGSLRAVLDAQGSVVKRITYDSFGNVLEDTNPALTLPFGFAGGLYDPDTGLLRFGFRDYAPDTGRWTAKDPIGFAGGDTNLYGYCVGDPVGWIDTDGLTVMEWAVPVAFFVSQLDSPLPGPADTIAGGIIGIAWIYDQMQDEDGTPCPEDVDQDEHLRRSGAGKNDAHGDGGRALSKAENQIKELEKQMENAPKKVKKDLRKTIERIRKNAQRKRKGETHWRR